MTGPLPGRRRLRWDDRTAGFVVVAIALLAAAAFVRNGWVEDDGPRILYDHRVQAWSGLWRGFVEPYWPRPSKSGLYRPLDMATFTLQWMVGGGSVLVFRVVDALLYSAAAFAVWRLTRRLLPMGAALIAALFFAVHPVHTEAMATAVNQAESAVVILLAFALLRWLDLERPGRSRSATFAMIGALYLGALAFKENALVLPALCLAVELLRAPFGPWRDWVRRRGSLLLGLVLLGAGWWLLRSVVLGDLTGAVAAEGLRGATIGERAIIMLSVVPEWTRLLLWPAILRSDYAPMQIDPGLTWTAAKVVGLLLLLTWVATFVWGMRHDRRIAAGLAFLAVALFPVSNVVVPTGILLAERTLFLPSVGAALILGALVARGAGWWERATPSARAMIQGGAVLLAAAALVRDVARAPDWHDFKSFVAAELRDAPYSWRAQTAAGIVAMEDGDQRSGEIHLRTAIALWPNHARPYHTLADYYRGAGLCTPALPLYAAGLEREPDRPRQRLSATACELWLGNYPAAAAIARGGAPTDVDDSVLHAAARTADSAAAVHARPQTVRLSATKDHAGEIGWRLH